MVKSQRQDTKFIRWGETIVVKDGNLFTWNDLVTIKLEAPLAYFPGKIAVICGMEKIKSEKLSHEFDVNMGGWLYTVEFGDGSSIEVPEMYLEKYQR